MNEPQTAPKDEFFDSLLGDFLDESGQLLDRLNENLLKLDEWAKDCAGESRRCDADLLNDMFRSAHSLKGLSAMLGLSDINLLTHKVENVFDAARKNDLTVDSDVVELVFQAVDRLVGLVDQLKDADQPPVECNDVIARIGDLLESAGVARQQTSQADAERALKDLTDATPAAAPAAAPAPPPAGPTENAAPSATAPSAPAPSAPAPSVPDPFVGLTDDVESAIKYLPLFIAETRESLDELTETLLTLEGGSGTDVVEKLMIVAHRIKGSAASVGLNRPAKLAHLMEDLLQNLKETGGALTPRLTDSLLACTDGLRRRLESLEHKEAGADNFPQLARELLDAHRGNLSSLPAAPAAPNAAPASAAERQEISIPASLAAEVERRSTNHENTLVGLVRFQSDLALVGLKGRLVYEKLSNLGDVCHFEPPLEGIEELDSLAEVGFGVITQQTVAEVRSKLRIGGVAETAIERLLPEAEPKTVPTASGASQAAVAAAASSEAASATSSETASKATSDAKGRAADSSSKPSETLRVDIERLDQLMNLAGQLVINKARFSQIADKLREAVSSKRSSQALQHACLTLDRIAGDGCDDGAADPAAELARFRAQARRMQADLDAVRKDVESILHARGAVNDLFETIHQLDRVSTGIQQSVMDTRMLPIGPLFGRFKRVIRDITRSNGRLINLVINGEKTELDKRMIDELGDPLIHMVRNSADHGIEMPDVRQAAGKPREGTITLDAFHRGNNIVIQVTDDGKGLDAERIRRKAIEKGVITEADAEKMTRQQIYQLIWEPGLSTAEKVTEVSGRGMGMDIVKSKIEQLNGAIELDSEPGKGTQITIKLPLTLAILPSLMVDIEGDTFAMPLEAVQEIVNAAPEDFSTVCGQKLARVRGKVIPAMRLGDLVRWNDAPATADPTAGAATTLVAGSTAATLVAGSTAATLVVVGEAGREIGLVVDCVLGEEDIVIKSIAENYRNVQAVAGASILGDGRVSLILDIACLIELASRQAVAGAQEE